MTPFGTVLYKTCFNKRRQFSKWFQLLLCIWIFVLCGIESISLGGEQIENRNDNNFSHNDFGCPLINCSCLGEYFECTKLNLKTVPDIKDWTRSL